MNVMKKKEKKNSCAIYCLTWQIISNIDNYLLGISPENVYFGKSKQEELGRIKPASPFTQSIQSSLCPFGLCMMGDI